MIAIMMKNGTSIVLKCTSFVKRRANVNNAM